MVSNHKAVTPNGRKGTLRSALWNSRVLILMCVPAIAYFLAFSYAPLPGIYVAFVNYNYRSGIFGSQFVGLKNFDFVAKSGKLWMLTRNTILFNVAFIVLDNLLAVTVAILLKEIQSKAFRKVTQTMMFLPYFISQVLVGLLVFSLLNSDTGFLNVVRAKFGMEPLRLYKTGDPWPFIIILVHLWQKTGYNSVVYFAAIMGIDAAIIEASMIDGANGWQKIRHIILPSLRPTIVILLLFALGGIVKGDFGLFWNLVGRNPILYQPVDIIEMFVYRATVSDFNFSTASAVGLYQSLIGFVLVVSVNAVVKKLEPDYSLF
ncbi:MAG: ABC transporter permease [Christensenellales bacterium]|jgi:putative aldouronate transport system permease protein